MYICVCVCVCVYVTYTSSWFKIVTIWSIIRAYKMYHFTCTKQNADRYLGHIYLGQIKWAYKMILTESFHL